MGGICPKADKVKAADRKNQKVILSSTVDPSDSKSKINMNKVKEINGGKGKILTEENDMQYSQLMANLSKKVQTPGDSKPVVDFIRLNKKQDDKFDSKFFRSEHEFSQSGRSGRGKLKSAFGKFSFQHGGTTYAVGDQLFGDEEGCLDVLQCISESSGQLFTFKLINVLLSKAALGGLFHDSKR